MCVIKMVFYFASVEVKNFMVLSTQEHLQLYTSVTFPTWTNELIRFPNQASWACISGHAGCNLPGDLGLCSLS